jgi:hypothetical protein
MNHVMLNEVAHLDCSSLHPINFDRMIGSHSPGLYKLCAFEDRGHSGGSYMCDPYLYP